MVRGSHFSNEFKDLMEKIFTNNGSERLTLEQIKEHPFYNGKATDYHQEFIKNVLMESQEKGEKP